MSTAFPKKGELLTLRAEGLDDDGLATAKVMVGERRLKVHMDDGVPGDLVQMRVVGRQRDALFGRVAEVLEPSPDRQPTLCIHLRAEAPCGGCALQAMTYEAQLRHKRERVRRHFENFNLHPELAPTLAAPTQLHHRHKIELTFGKDRTNALALGMHPSGYRWEIITTDHCLLVTPWAAGFVRTILDVAAVHGLDSYELRTGQGELRNVVVREGKRTRERLVEMITSPSLSDERGKAFIDALAERAGDAVTTWVWTTIDAERGRPTRLVTAYVRGSGVMSETLHLPDDRQVSLSISPRAFFQPHPLAAERLLAEVIQRLHSSEATHVADLYCGTGTLSLAIAPFVSSVVGVEIVPEAIDDARANVARNGFENVTFVVGDVGQVLADPQHADTFARVDTVLLDPPRSGLMPQAFEAVTRLAPRTIIYVSCQPKTLARDLAGLAKLGFAIVGVVQPVDLFPQSPHVESVTMLARERAS